MINNISIKIDKTFEYIPFVSTVNSIVALFNKYVVFPYLERTTIDSNPYFKHIDQKNAYRTVTLLFPFLGNLLVALFDYSKNLQLWGLILSTPSIDHDFTSSKTIDEQRTKHEEAKQFLIDNLKIINSNATFVSHSIVECPKAVDVEIDPKRLDQSIFSVQNTHGVTEDILADGQRDEDNIVIYGVASQFNGCEAPSKYTVKPGFAVLTYCLDDTQGPAAQLAFSRLQVEMINCSGNIGYNALCYALDEDTIAEVAHGYLTPEEPKAAKVVEHLSNNGTKIEYPCIAAIPRGGKSVVHQILVAAPAFGLYNSDLNEPMICTNPNRMEIEFLCALHAYRAQFETCIQCAKTSEKPVVFKPTATGLNAFCNNPVNAAKAFYVAAMEYQARLKEKNVTVAFQRFYLACPYTSAGKLINLLGLKNKTFNV